MRNASGAAYTFEDISPAAGNNYYRLKITDADGSYHHSSIVIINTKKNGGLLYTLYPNPTPNGVITVNSTINEPLHFYVFDLEGTLLHRIILRGKEQKTITNLKKGTYMYDVFKNDESFLAKMRTKRK